MKNLIIMVTYLLSMALTPEEIDVQKVIKKYKGVPEIPKELKGVWTLIDKVSSCGPPDCYLKKIITICKYPIIRKSMQIDTATEKINYEDTYKGFISYPPEKLNKMYIFSINEYDEFGNSFGGYFSLWYDPKKFILFRAELSGVKDDELINRIDLTKEKCPEESKEEKSKKK